MEHSTWLLGDGNKIHFWSDQWCGQPFNLFLTNEVVDQSILVSDYIQDNCWNLPPEFSTDFPNVWNLVHKVSIPMQEIEDDLVWTHTTNGSLSFKDAYKFKDTPSQSIQWAKTIWSPNIPPIKISACMEINER